MRSWVKCAKWVEIGNWGILSDEWWVMSDKNWMRSDEQWKKKNQTAHLSPSEEKRKEYY